ncbi:hypothetical protein [Bacillus niameyensis]|uniref:hypothetical protein n=1 Tax=Bacillus niameyensis TaxID=1522308 RepID=UPI000781F211|nr:hypothetical protein [Bacillus niameyensis]
MGHDISGYNKANEKICYIRFNMSNPTAFLFYKLLDAQDYNGGVSGIGAYETYELPDIEKALDHYYEIFGNEGDIIDQKNLDFATWQRREILKFINSCLETAIKEGSVRVAFA